MTIKNLIKRIPKYALDIRYSLEDIFSPQYKLLTDQQRYGIALSVGYSLNNESLLNHIRADARLFLEEADADACKVAAIMMSLNNTYCNFIHSLKGRDLSKIPHNLPMSSLGESTIDPVNFHMYCLSISILNNCQYCINKSSESLVGKVSDESLLEVGRITSILRAMSDVLNIELMRSYDFIDRVAS